MITMSPLDKLFQVLRILQISRRICRAKKFIHYDGREYGFVCFALNRFSMIKITYIYSIHFSFHILPKSMLLKTNAHGLNETN